VLILLDIGKAEVAKPYFSDAKIRKVERKTKEFFLFFAETEFFAAFSRWNLEFSDNNSTQRRRDTEIIVIE